MRLGIGIRFDNGPKIHWADAPDDPPPPGTACVVRSRRGLELGRVRSEPRERERTVGEVVRRATEEDLATHERLAQRAEDLTWLLRARARQNGIEAKIVSLEFTLDESLLLVHYSADQHPALRVFAQELVQYTAARIEFVNVGPRDQARILGTLGKCGDASCSSTWIQGFSSVSIRMARDQQLPLNPEKISGTCGRLMCCLQYEHDMYKELLKGMPKKGSKACHDESGACGRVVKLDPLRRTVDLRTNDGLLEGLPAEEVRRASGR